MITIIRECVSKICPQIQNGRLEKVPFEVSLSSLSEMCLPETCIDTSRKMLERNCMAPDTCPNCGADVPPAAKCCPEFGSDETTGWSEDAQSSGLDLPDDNFNYEEFAEREFGGKKPVPHGIHWFWWVVGIVILLAIALLWIH